MADVEADVIVIYGGLIDDLLNRAEQVKPGKEIEPPLTETHLGDSIWVVQGEDESVVKQLSQQTQFAAVEIAFRERFYSLLASTSIDEPEFIRIWNLLDIISIFSDNEQCEPGLIFWLIEELLDSQTIDGCRKKHFKQKSLIILRSCNELLRRLSRAEDTVFCGRVFIFLFQSFPLGDKSAVNLRGEYHTENVTTFDEIAKPGANDEMDVDVTDAKESNTSLEQKQDADIEPGLDKDAKTSAQESPKTPRLVVSKTDGQEEKKEVDLDTLYSIFWGLQAYFSAPTKVFDTQHFATFKTGLDATLFAFKDVNTDLEAASNSRGSEEIRKSTKRKRAADDQEIASSFNPKYLTSRDLFDLEVNDTAFRRHVLVQALILLDFMLSLTPKSKTRLTDLTNKSVLYGFILNEEDTKWAIKMRKSIEEYLQEGVGGKFYYRMVDTVLSRDKNWVRWKAEGCPLIERAPISVTEYLGAREHATKTYANKRLRPSPMGSLNLKFLSENESSAGLERLKKSERFTVPAPDSLKLEIEDDEFEIETATAQGNKEEEEHATRAKASKTWRLLRLFAKSKLATFEKIEDGKNLKALFEISQPPESMPHALGTPQTLEATKSTEIEPSGPGHSHEINNPEDGNASNAIEQRPTDMKDAVIADAVISDAPAT